MLSVDGLTGEDATTLEHWIEPIADAVGAEILITDDADGFKTVANELGLDQQVCKSHVKRNTEALVETLQAAIATGDGEPASLVAIGVSAEQAIADLNRLLELVNDRNPDHSAELGVLHHRYIHAAPPAAGERATIAYRLRLLFLDRWNAEHGSG